MASSWLGDYKRASGKTIKSKPLRKRLAAKTMEDTNTTEGTTKKQKTTQKATQKGQSSWHQEKESCTKEKENLNSDFCVYV